MEPNRQRDLYLLDPRRLTEASTSGALVYGQRPLLDAVTIETRVRIAELIAADLEANPPRRMPNGTLAVDREGLWRRLRDATVATDTAGRPVRLELAPGAGHPNLDSFDLEKTARVLLSALDRRRELSERLRAYDALAAYFPSARADLERQSEEELQRVASTHRGFEAVAGMRNTLDAVKARS